MFFFFFTGHPARIRAALRPHQKLVDVLTQNLSISMQPLHHQKESNKSPLHEMEDLFHFFLSLHLAKDLNRLKCMSGSRGILSQVQRIFRALKGRKWILLRSSTRCELIKRRSSIFGQNPDKSEPTKCPKTPWDWLICRSVGVVKTRSICIGIIYHTYI